MFNLDYSNLHGQIEEKMKDPTVSIWMRKALLDFSVALYKVRIEELKEIVGEDEDEVITSESIGC